MREMHRSSRIVVSLRNPRVVATGVAILAAVYCAAMSSAQAQSQPRGLEAWVRARGGTMSLDFKAFSGSDPNYPGAVVIDLADATLGDSDLKDLASFKQPIGALDLSGTPLTDAGLEYLAA